MHPKHDHPASFPVVFIEPVENSLAAVGLDVAFENSRRTAALLVRDLGTAQISGPITLVQDHEHRPGFLFYAPYYLDDTGFEGLVLHRWWLETSYMAYWMSKSGMWLSVLKTAA